MITPTHIRPAICAAALLGLSVPVAHAQDFAFELGLRGGTTLLATGAGANATAPNTSQMLSRGIAGLCADSAAWLRSRRGERGVSGGATLEYCQNKNDENSLMSIRGGLGLGMWQVHDTGLHHRFSINLGAGQVFQPVPDATNPNLMFVSLRPEAVFGHFLDPIGYFLGVYVDLSHAVNTWPVGETLEFAPQVAVGFRIGVAFGRIGGKSMRRGGGANGGSPGSMSY